MSRATYLALVLCSMSLCACTAKSGPPQESEAPNGHHPAVVADAGESVATDSGSTPALPSDAGQAQTDGGGPNGTETCNGKARNVPCGLNRAGTQPQLCTSGQWENDGACNDPDVCANGTTREIACGLNNTGTQPQLCTRGRWENGDACRDPDTCADDKRREIACGLNNIGVQGQVCANGQWQNDGSCIDPDACINANRLTRRCERSLPGVGRKSGPPLRPILQRVGMRFPPHAHLLPPTAAALSFLDTLKLSVPIGPPRHSTGKPGWRSWRYSQNLFALSARASIGRRLGSQS